MSFELAFFAALSSWAPIITSMFALPFVHREEHYHRAMLYITFLLLTIGLVGIVKQLTDIPRPADAMVQALGSAFPSGHAAMGFYPVGFYWLFSGWKDRTLLFAYGLLVAYSRLALNVHFVVDLVAGAVVGFAIPYIVMYHEEHALRAWRRFNWPRR